MSVLECRDSLGRQVLEGAFDVESSLREIDMEVRHDFEKRLKRSLTTEGARRAYRFYENQHRTSSYWSFMLSVVPGRRSPRR